MPLSCDRLFSIDVGLSEDTASNGNGIQTATRVFQPHDKGSAGAAVQTKY